ncbi:MAG TPA: phospholipase D-like domain-containing protein [Actinomycetota bacterium]
MSGLEVEFLRDGGQHPADVAGRLVGWVRAARSSLDVAIYDFHARTGASAAVADALEAAAARGVRVRVVFNAEVPRHPAAPRPAACRPEDIDGLDVPTRAVAGGGALMHHKYAVRDATSVWAGSTNWTDDAFAREENVVLRVEHPDVAAAYGADFDRLWTHGTVEAGGGEAGPVQIDGRDVRVVLSPRGPSLAQAAASLLGEARGRIRVLTPVLTAGPVLGTLAEFATRPSFDLGGAYDETQMEEVRAQWQGVTANRWKIDAWDVIRPRLAGKRSTPYREGAVHDYMHAKVLVADEAVLTGSYNLSHGGEDNDEDVLLIRDRPLADRFAAFADAIAARYAPSVRSG